MIEYFGNSHVFFTLTTKKVLNFWDIPIQSVVKIFGIPMSFLGCVHLTSGIANYVQDWKLLFLSTAQNCQFVLL